MFTAKQLKDFKAYVKVQRSGKWNMLDPRAASATKLTQDEYVFVMKNYSELKKEVDKASV
jgi:hypothetical protein